ncbi:MAG: hypothetical protein ACUVQ0_05950 [Thermoproteota archaeon]
MGVEVSIEKTPVSSLLNRSDVQALLRAFMDGSIKVLKPEPSPTGDITYPEAEKIMGASSRVVVGVLEALSKEGILVKELATALLACPYCGGVKFVIELADTYSYTASRSKAIENIVSGLLGKRLICIAGQHVFHENEGASKKLYFYKFNPERKAFVERWVMNLKPLVEALSSKGWVVQHPARIRGRSGVEHTFTLAVNYEESKDKVDVVIDIIVSETLVDESALSIVLKAMDVKASKKLLLVVPGLTEKARTLFDYYNTYDIHVLELENVGQINSALFEVLNSLSKLKARTIAD